MNVEKNKAGEKRVPLANRYAGAWFEYNARMTARHNLTTMYLGSASILISVLYSTTDKPLPEMPLAGNQIFNTIYATTFLIPTISLIYALYLLMHDGIMGGIHNYMKVCEEYDNMGEGALPSYHADKLWNDNFFYYRKIQSLISMMLIGLFCILAIVRSEKHMSTVYVNMYCIYTLISLIIIGFSYKVRSDMGH